VSSFYFDDEAGSGVNSSLAGYSNIYGYGWQPLYLAEEWDQNFPENSIFNNVVGWDSVNPVTFQAYNDAWITPNPIFSQVDPTGMTDDPFAVDFLEFRQFNMSLLSANAEKSLWFKATYTGGTNFQNIEPVSELAGGETAYLVLAGWSPVYGKAYSGLTLQVPYPYQNSSATIHAVLEADSLTFNLPSGGQSGGDKKYIPSDPVQENTTDSGGNGVVSSSSSYPAKKITTPVVSSLSSPSALKKAKIKIPK
jgi:hypothetical protein